MLMLPSTGATPAATVTMPPLDWGRFEALGGDSRRNWEALSREAVRRTYGHLGALRSVSQQPGVEFHLRLTSPSDALGPAGRWWGWQCRWYEIGPGRPIGSTRRSGIVDAVAKTSRHLPSVTDWVLWTRHPLTSGDQNWFYDLNTSLTLHLWTADHTEGLLSGEAVPLLSVYFGQHAFTSHDLDRSRKLAIKPIERRWDPRLAVQSNAELKLRQALGEHEAWGDIPRLGERLDAAAAELDTAVGELPNDGLRDGAADLVEDARTLVGLLQESYLQMEERDVIAAHGLLKEAADRPERVQQRRRLLARLRAGRLAAVLLAQQVWASVREAVELARNGARRLGEALVGIVGGAGEGKSFLSAEITAPARGRPAGFFLAGRNLRRRASLDELAARVPEANLSTWTELLEAAEAAGARAGARIPVVIDGLNESESPHDWLDLLSVAQGQLDRYPRVLLIVTLRATVFEISLPNDTPAVELVAFEGRLHEALERYFEHYRIDAPGLTVPRWLLSSPLVLRLFCEAANPDRDRYVAITDLPLSLTAVFERYRDAAVQRAAQDAEMLPADVDRGLTEIGLALWEANARVLPSAELGRLLVDEPREWARSPARALEEHGVLMRDPGPEGRSQVSALLFDQFGGHVVADALVQRLGRDGVQTWLSESETRRRLQGVGDGGHPLGEDILEALAWLLPRRFQLQLWPLLEDPLRKTALRRAAELEPRFIDAATRQALLEFTVSRPDTTAERRSASRRSEGSLFDRLTEVGDIPDHPLNADFLDECLRALAVWERDLLWSEWLRTSGDDLPWNQDRGAIRELRRLEQRWLDQVERGERDRLTALRVAWMQTVTDRHLRDRASSALHAYGLIDPAGLFDLALSLLDVDDAYVSSRMLTVAYGVCLSRQLPDPSMEAALAGYLKGLSTAVLADAASDPTWHSLSRDAIGGTFAFAATLFPNALPPGIAPFDLPFAAGVRIHPGRRHSGRRVRRDLTDGLCQLHGRRNYFSP